MPQHILQENRLYSEKHAYRSVYRIADIWQVPVIYQTLNQCSDPASCVFVAHRSWSFHQLEKKLGKALISTVFRLLNNFLSFKTDLNEPAVGTVTVVSKKLRRKDYFFLASWKSMKKLAGPGSVIQWYGSSDPYLKRSRIRNRVLHLTLNNKIN